MSEFVAEPVVTLDKEQTLAILREPENFMNSGLNKYRWKSQWLCDLLDAREAEAGRQYNAEFQRWLEKAFNLGPFDENGSALSLLVFNAQSFRRHDKMLRLGFKPGSEELLREAFEKKVDIELYSEPLFKIVINGAEMVDPNIHRLKVREIGGKLYAMYPKKRKYAVAIGGKPVRLAEKGSK